MAFKSLVALIAALAVVSASEPPFDGAEGLPIQKPLYKVGTPVFLGSGCNKDTVAIIPTGDGGSFSAYFSGFSAKTSPSVLRDRKSCNLVIPVDVQDGISIGLFRVDYRGYVDVPKTEGSYTQFDAEYFFAGSRGPVISKKFESGTTKSITITNDAPIVWSACGASTNFRVNSAVTAYKPTLNSTGEAQIATVEAAFHYYVAWKTC